MRAASAYAANLGSLRRCACDRKVNGVLGRDAAAVDE
jgi:hypothetical protein